MARQTPKKKKRVRGGRIVWGRPTKYATAELFETACRKYFSSLKFWTGPSIAGLCVSIGLSRETWYDYKKKRKEFSDTIRTVEMTIEAWWVDRLSKQGAVGAIFYLKNFKPDEYKDRVPGDSPKNPQWLQITGMKITKE